MALEMNLHVKRELDIVIFGATGFTGKYCIPVIHKLSKDNNRNLKWGLAGRNEAKLKNVLKEHEQNLGTTFDDVPIIVADVENEKSLHAMAARTRLVVNCCGPFRLYGEPVVKACVEEKTHHIDISGEPQYMEAMQLKYHEQAKENRVYVVSACGFDSIPTDMGIVFLQNKFEGTLNSIVTYMDNGHEGEPIAGPSIHYGTWESAIYGLAHANELKSLRRKLFNKKMPTFEPKLKQHKLWHKTDLVDGYALPFLGSDRSVVRRSQRYFYEEFNQRPVQVETYFMLKKFLYVILMMLFGLVFKTLCSFSFGRKVLLKYPELFSNGLFSKNVNEEKIKKIWFSVNLYGEGWKEKLENADDSYKTPMDKCIVGKVSGFNPGYGATCIMLVTAAVKILTESDKLPNVGGVYPPGVAFAKTSLCDELNENGIKFEILYQKDLKK